MWDQTATLPMNVILAPSQKALTPHLEIRGGRRLGGEIRVSGAKNSALVLMAACLLSSDDLKLRNMPALSDIQGICLLYTSPSPRDKRQSRMPSSA